MISFRERVVIINSSELPEREAINQALDLGLPRRTKAFINMNLTLLAYGGACFDMTQAKKLALVEA